MTFQYSITAAALVLFSAACPGLANDATHAFPAGGLVFTSGDNLSIAREDIELSAAQVLVHYVIQSAAKAPVTTTLSFPMAKVPQDDTPDSLAELAPDMAQDNLKNYMAFAVTVDGKPLAPKLHEFAWSGDKDLTADFLKMGVPIFAASEDAPEMLGKLPDTVKHQLAMQKLAAVHGDWIIPRWDYQAVFDWPQTFAPGKTEIDITYKPILGHPKDMNPRALTDDDRKAYCIPPNFEKDNAERVDMLDGVETLGFVTRAANSSNGPIGEFHLKVDEGQDALASLCVPAGMTATDKPLQWMAKDFTPKDDLKMVFLVP
jgi:hypothetical protein